MKVWIFQTGEPLHCDTDYARPMRAVNLANHLAQNGHEVIIWSSDFYHQKKMHRFNAFKDIQVTSQIRNILIPSPGYKKNISFGRLYDHLILAKNLSFYLNQENGVLPDVAFVGYPPIETSYVATQWLKHRNIPTIIDVKDLWPSLFLDPIPPLFKPLVKLALAPYFFCAHKALKNATAFSSMSEGYLNWMSAFSGRPLNVLDRVNPLTSPIKKISESSYQESRRWWSLLGVTEENKKRVCFIGSLMSVYDFSSIKNAAIRLEKEGNNCQIVICGDGGNASQIKEELKGLKNIIFAGWVDLPKISFLTANSSAALIPYRNIENFTLNMPNKVIDALAYGLPIITTLGGNVATLVDENKIGYVCNDSTGMSTYDAIKELLESPKIQEKLSVNAKTLYNNCYVSENVYNELVKFLEGLAKNE